MSNSKKNEKKNAVLNTLKFYLPVAWKLSKRYFIVSVINVIVQAVLPFIDLIFLPLLVDALCQPERSVPQIILYAALMVGLDIAVGTAGSQLTIYLQRFEDKFLNYSREMVAERCMEKISRSPRTNRRSTRYERQTTVSTGREACTVSACSSSALFLTSLR